MSFQRHDPQVTRGERDAPGRLEAGNAPRCDDVVDAVGLYCPVPIIRTAARARRLEPGRVLEVLVDDPVTLIDMPNWCRSTGHRYLGWMNGPGVELRLFIGIHRNPEGPAPESGC